MAVSTSKAVDVPALIAYGDDLISLLKNKKEINGLIHSVDGAKKLLSSCQAESSELQIQIQDYQNKIRACKQSIDEAKNETDYQNKIRACKQSIDEAKNETDANTELERLQNELEEELEKEKVLREELRFVNDEINDLECQRVIIEEQKRQLWKVEKDELRQQKKLSMYASVTNIIPDLGNESRISGRVVQRDKRMVEKFDLGPAKGNPFEISNSLWKIMDI